MNILYKNIVFLFFCLYSSIAFASGPGFNDTTNQPLTSGSNPNFSVNVGIGSSVPGQKLDVQGTIRATGFIAGAGGITLGGVNNTSWPAGGSNYWLNTAAAGNVGISTTNTVGIGTTSAGAGAGLVVMNGNVGIGTFAPLGALQIVGTGNVGIGSTAPGVPLDVNGKVRMTGFNLSTSPNSGYVLTSDANGNGTWTVAAGGSNYWNYSASGNIGVSTVQAVGIGTTFVGGTGEAALAVMNGNVGIGTWVPGSSLQVNGSAVGNVPLTVNGYSGQTADLQDWSSSPGGTIGAWVTSRGDLETNYNVVTGYWVQAQGYEANGTGPILFNGSGSTSSAYSALFDQTINGFGLSTVGGDLEVAAQLYYNGTGTVTGNWTSLGLVNTFGNGSANTYNGSAPMTSLLINPTINVNTSSTTGYTEIYAQSVETSIGAGAPNYFIQHLASGASTPNFVVTEKGNVGIGSATPGQALDVQGTIRATGFIAGAGGITLGGVNNTSWPAGGSNYWLNTAAAGNVGISTTNTVGIGTTSGVGAGLVVMNGNVGIGTWAPAATLDINGNFRTSGSTSNTTLNATGGNVGIGSANPGMLLDVAGNIRGTQVVDTGVTASSLVYANSSQQLASVTIGSGLTLSGATLSASGGGSNYWLNTAAAGNVGISTTNTVGIGTTSGVGAGLVVMNGNVGIGTWIPAGGLDNAIAGAASMPGTRIEGTWYTAGSATTNKPQLLVEPAGATSTAWSTSGTGLGVNAASGFSGNLLDLQLNGISQVKVSSNGYTTIQSGMQATSVQGQAYSTTAYTSTSSSASFPAPEPVLAQNTAGVDGEAAPLVMISQNGSYTPQTAWIAAVSNTGGGSAYTPNIVIGQQTGATAYAERMRIDKNGNVGIGSTNPGQVLDVNGTVRATGFVAGAAGITLGGVNNTSWPGGGGSNYWLNTAAAGNVGISTTNTVGIGTTSGVGAGLVVMNGNVGIGTWVPNASLTTIGDIDSEFSGTSQTRIVGIGLLNGFSTGDTAIFRFGDQYNQLSATVGSILTLSAYHGVQITSNPFGGAPTGAALLLVNSSNTTASGQPVEIVRGVSGQTADLFQAQNSASTTLFNITAAGNVGIGTTTPAGALTVMNGNVGIGTWAPVDNFQVNVSDSQNGIRIVDNGSKDGIDFQGYYPAINFNNYYQSSDGNQHAIGPDYTGAITFLPGSGDIEFDTGQAPGSGNVSLENGVMWVMNSGNVGIGIYGALNLLDVNGSEAVGTYAGNDTGPSNGLIVSGNVGIGTFAPVSALQVVGNVGIGTSTIASTPYTLNVNNVAVFNSEYNNGTQGSSFTVNWANGSKQTVTLAGTGLTATFTNPSVGVGNFQLKIVQDGTGSRTITTWTPSSGNIYWSGGSAPTLTTTADYLDIVSCYYDGTNYYCAATLNFQ